jgi:hypothetical protein
MPDRAVWENAVKEPGLLRRRGVEGEAEVLHHGLGPIVDGTFGESGALTHQVHRAEVGGDESEEFQGINLHTDLWTSLP